MTLGCLWRFSKHVKLGGDCEQTQNTLEGLYVPSGLGTPRDSPRTAGGWEEGTLMYVVKAAATTTWNWISSRKWMESTGGQQQTLSTEVPKVSHVIRTCPF